MARHRGSIWRSGAVRCRAISLRLVSFVFAALLTLTAMPVRADTDQWVLLASMATDRAENTQTLLPNGKVLVTGGSSLQAPDGDERLVPINESEVYDPASNTWTSAGLMSTARASHTATLLNNGKVLVVGGLSDYLGSVTNNVDLYDPATNSWAPAAPLNTARQSHTATRLPDGRVLVAGGSSSSFSALQSAEIYDPATNTWTNAAPMNDARFEYPAVLLANGRVLVAAGIGTSYSLLTSAELFDPASGSWTRTGSLSVGARALVSVLLPSGKVLAEGGLGDNVNELTNVEIYDPATGSWTAGAEDTVVTDPEPAVVLQNGKVLVAGLYGTSGLYDPVANSWSQGAAMSVDVITLEPGGGLLTLLPNGKVFAAGGETAQAELYTPPGPPIAGPVTATVGFDSSNNSITPDLSGGVTFIVAVQNQPAHGKAAANGASLIYTPNAGYAGSDSFTYIAENGDGNSAPATVTVNVEAPSIGVSPQTFPTFQVGARFSATVTASGGTAPYTYSISAGALPAGVTLDATSGALSGVPTAGGNASFTVSAADSSAGSGPFQGSQLYLTTVLPPDIVVLPTILPNAQQGSAYSATISASGGTAPYSFTISSGALPNGLQLDRSTGRISGTPSAGGTASFAVLAVDSSTGTGPFQATHDYTLTIQAPTGQPPTASALSVSTACDTAVSINLATGISGLATSVAIAAQPSHGAVQLNGETATYTPATGYCGNTDSFSYTAGNAAGTSAPATVAVSIANPAASAKAYIANYGDGTVSVIDTGTGAVNRTIQAGSAPDAVVISPDGATGYVGSSQTGQVTVFSTATGTVTAAVTVGNGAYGMAMSPDGSHVYVANSGGRSLSVISTTTNTVTKTIPLGNGDTLSAPRGVAVSPDGGTVYVADNGLSQIEVIDTASLAVTGTIPTGQIPYAVAFSPDGSRAYVANNQDNTVTVISTAARAGIATIQVGPAPMELAVSPDGTKLYVDNSNEFKNPDIGSVTVISTATDTVVATVPVGLSPDGIAVTPDGSLIYVINTDSNTVSVISAATNSVVSAIPVGKYPHGRGVFMGPGSSSSGADTLAASVLPGGRSVQVGTPATLFATLLNAGTSTAQNCTISLTAGAPAGLSLGYQTTNPATNAPTGTPSTPVDIVQGGYQTFLLSFTSTTPLSVAAEPLDFSCSNATPAASTPGVDTVDLTFSDAPITDIVALAATATQDGTLHLTQGQPGAFAVATVNLGAAGGLIVSVDTGSASLPLALSLCQTNPTTGQCLSVPSAAVSASIGQNATPTFSIFARPSGPIAFAPGTSRLFVRFKDSAGATHGSTSVAVTAQ